MTQNRTKETKLGVVGQVQGYVITSFYIVWHGNDLALLLPEMPQSRTYKPAGLKGAVIVMNVTRESGMVKVHRVFSCVGHMPQLLFNLGGTNKKNALKHYILQQHTSAKGTLSSQHDSLWYTASSWRVNY